VPELKSVTEKTTHPLPEFTAAPSRETAPAASQASSQPSLRHAHPFAAAASSRVEANGPKDGGAAQPVIGPSYAAAYLSNPAPKYPAAARRLRLQGTATLRVLVSAEGRPMTVTLQKTSGTRVLDEAALDAVQQWSFVPARRGSKPVAAEVDVPLRFTLK
jgi:protein TonB